MYKKIIWALVILLILLISGYLKFVYPGSQAQLKKEFRFVNAMPIEHYYNAYEKSCGIVYERVIDGNVVQGKTNDSARECFQKSFERCESKNVFFVKDESELSDKKITYSLIKIIKKNDQNECLIQNYYEEQNLSLPEDVPPISFVNTCTVLKEGDKAAYSCEPLYIMEERAKRVELKNKL
ncbi:MAG: hypothetical protein AAB766_01780 [Patescibacteria group bacterium]